MSDPTYDSMEYSLRRGLFGGYVVVWRDAIPEEVPGNWRWSRWKKAKREHLHTIISALHKAGEQE